MQIYAAKLTPAIVPYSKAIEALAKARPLTFLDSREESLSTENTLVLVLKNSEVVIPMESMVNLEAEKKRLEKEIAQNQAEVSRLEARLKDKNFLTRAPVNVVDRERQKLYTLSDKLGRLKQETLKY